MIDALGIEKSFGSRKLFGPLNLRMDGGERWALVGPNGSGKTTLLRILAGVERPDAGEVRGRRGLSVGYLPQEAEVDEGTPLLAFVEDVAEEVRAAGEEMRSIGAALAADPGDRPLLERYGHLQARYEHLGGYRLRADARRILAGLGFAEEEFGRPVSSFSGGWRMRALLARILLRDPDVILLDEPTNHLDIVSLEWIEEFIRASKAVFLIVSHDVAFLDRIVTGIFALEPGGLAKAKGTYARYAEERAERLRSLEAAQARQARKRAEEERFIERFRAKNTKARAVQSRIKRLEKEEVIEAPSEEVARPVFSFPQPVRSGKEVATLVGVTVSYGEKAVYDDLDFSLQRGEKVALIGPNGAGKSTLLKLLAGVVVPSRGTFALGLNVTVSYFAQHQMELLDARNTVLDEILRLPGYRTEREARSLLGAFLFSGDDVEKRVAVLSGGEKSRLALARMMADPGNLLLLDEPTNHLDIAACGVLKDALASFAGTLAVITHDRDLIDRMATRVIYVNRGECRSYPGNYGDYLRLRELAERAGTSIAKDSGRPGRSAERGGSRGREARRAEAQRRDEERRRTGPLRAEVEELEREIGEKEGRMSEVEGLLADPGIYADPARAAELGRERVRLAGEIDALTGRWERAAAALEEVEAALRAEAAT